MVFTGAKLEVGGASFRVIWYQKFNRMMNASHKNCSM